MEPQNLHDSQVRLTMADGVARLAAGGLELMAGPIGPYGRGDWWLPEELLVAAVSASLLEAVRAQARRERLAIGTYTCVGETALHERKEPRLILRISIEAAPDDVPRLEGLVHRAKEACVLAGALAMPLELQLTPLPSRASLGAQPR